MLLVFLEIYLLIYSLLYQRLFKKSTMAYTPLSIIFNNIFISNLYWYIPIPNQFIPSSIAILFFSLVFHAFLPDFLRGIQSYPKPSICILSNRSAVLCFTFSFAVCTAASDWSITSTALNKYLSLNNADMHIYLVFSLSLDFSTSKCWRSSTTGPAFLNSCTLSCDTINDGTMNSNDARIYWNFLAI